MAREREIIEQRKQILDNLSSSVDQGFSVFSQEKKKEKKEKKRKRKGKEDEFELPDDMWQDFGLTKEETEKKDSQKEKEEVEEHKEVKKSEKNDIGHEKKKTKIEQ
jgi:hypothetical protein